VVDRRELRDLKRPIAKVGAGRVVVEFPPHRQTVEARIHEQGFPQKAVVTNLRYRQNLPERMPK
jgi:hypothetical protein